ncbi:hypothetical protein Poli38472_002558 [Pythium oligandrum]|uniref:Uncharacterized protein n=1 Tax=Pythium oligandrum TaxID=41045 RepID=A0A8K1FL96_PYTOL|nr:hypothetical protein Poli38472_002558 [Pythium oligandrum]|eukprot:TMW63617.1 hypothetical protein Poli38472_002558 [Pythium oligandrum]
MELSRILNLTHDTPRSCGKQSGQTLSEAERIGKWTFQEEQYALALVKLFLAGVLAVPAGTSLRSFLAKKLHCPPMRISTKLATLKLGGDSVPRRIGLKRFFPGRPVSITRRQHLAEELRVLERDFLWSIRSDSVSQSSQLLLAKEESAKTASLVNLSSDDDERSEDDTRPTARRIGNWSIEEQTYAKALIDAFLGGYMDVETGVTLRMFLSQKLSCDAMRVSKKLASGVMASHSLPKRIGRAVFIRRTGTDPLEFKRHELELERLRELCFSP